MKNNENTAGRKVNPMQLKEKSYRIGGALMVVIIIVQLTLVLASWIITAVKPEIQMRSMLSSEGIRWAFGYFSENLSTPFLEWMLLASIALGPLAKSRMLRLVSSPKAFTMREKIALQFVAAEIILYVAVMFFLTFIPHAILLSITGALFPSSFAYSIVPQISFMVCLISVTYGVVTGTLHSIADIFASFTYGFSFMAPIFVLYVLVIEFYKSLCFIMMWQ